MAQLRPTFSESWYRVMNLKARLRASAQISRQHYRGERWYVVRDPAGNQYHRLSAPAYRFVGLLDGRRTVAEAWDLVGGQLADDAPTQPEVIQILSQLHAANLLEADITADASVLLRRHKKMKSRQLQSRLMNFLFPRIPLWDADTFLCKWLPVMKHVLSKLGAIVWLVVVIGAIVKLLPNWALLKQGASDSIAPDNWPFLWATFVVIKLIHELGHGFFCRRFGGEIHEMGVMFLVFIPAPYVDASTAWGLPSKWQRMLVGMGGMIFELFVSAIMALVWLNTLGGAYPLVHQLAFNTMLIASVSTVIFNANPLLRYDGYYILSDLLEIPNLRQKSTEYALGLIKRHIFRIKSPLPLPPFGQRIWLLFYAIASSIYRVMVGIIIIFVVAGKVPVLGVLMAIGGAVTWAVVPIGKLFNYLFLEPELHRKRFGAAAFCAALAAVVIVAVGVIPVTVHYDATGVVIPAQRRSLRARSSGFVVDVPIRDGQFVHAGDVIVDCASQPMKAELEKLRDKRQAAFLHSREMIVVDQAQYLNDLKDIRTYDSQIADREQRIDDLQIRAPFDGMLIAPELDSLKGKYLHPGDEVGATVAKMQKLQICGLLDAKDAALPYSRPGQAPPDSGEIRLAGARSLELVANISRDAQGRPLWCPGGIRQLPPELQSMFVQYGGDFQLDPKDPKSRELAQDAFPVFLDLTGADGQVHLNDKDRTPLTGRQLYAGQRAYLRFELGKKPLLWQWWRRIGQIMQTENAKNNRWL